jgi:hypothetical protein
MRIQDPNLGSGNLFGPGPGMEKVGSWINIPDPQRWNILKLLFLPSAGCGILGAAGRRCTS